MSSLGFFQNSSPPFIESTTNRLQNLLAEFDLSCGGSLRTQVLRQELAAFMDASKKKRKYYANGTLLIPKELVLPLVIKGENPDLRLPREKIYKSKKKNWRTENEKVKGKDKGIGILEDMIGMNINQSLKSELNQLKVRNYMRKFQNSSDTKNRPLFSPIQRDQFQNAIIRNKDVQRGLYNMSVKGLFPRDADLTPALNLRGGPISIKKEKSSVRNEEGKNYILEGNLNSKRGDKKSYNPKIKEEVAIGLDTKIQKMKYSIKDIFGNEEGINQKVTFYNKTNKNINIYKNVLQHYDVNDSIIDTISEKSKTTERIIKPILITELTKKEIQKDNDMQKEKGSSTIRSNLPTLIIPGEKEKLYNNMSNINNIDISKSTSLEKSLNKSEVVDLKSMSSGYDVKPLPQKFSLYLLSIRLTPSMSISFQNYSPIHDKAFSFLFYILKSLPEPPSNRLIESVLVSFSLVLKKLKMVRAKIDIRKMVALLKFFGDDLSRATNRDLLMCIEEKSGKNMGFDPLVERELQNRIRESFIIRIQAAARGRLGRRRLMYIRFKKNQIMLIQRMYRGYLMRKSIKGDIQKQRDLIHINFIERLNYLKENWNTIQENHRLEIHMNSLSYDSYTNSITDKFMLKENLQLNRIVRLIDPNLSIIYIAPFQFPPEILSYFFSVLSGIGIEDAHLRFRVIVPEAAETLPANLSLARLLLLSPKALNEIRAAAENIPCYLVPGRPGGDEEVLSEKIGIPVLMGNTRQIDLIFNKSGTKSLFELNEIPFPISAWDIKTRDEFYSSLAHLIATYPTVQIWIFKMNNEINSRGIAYFDTGNIETINTLRRSHKVADLTTSIFERELLSDLRNLVQKHTKFVFPNLYSSFSEYLRKFLSQKGVIESCPTRSLETLGSPCIPMLIEPEGNIRMLPSYDRCNVEGFKNAVNTSPQKSIDNETLTRECKKIGKFLHSQEIIGYVTVEFIVFHNGKKILYWANDLKYGLSQIISDLQFAYFLYIQCVINSQNLPLLNIGQTKNNNESQSKFIKEDNKNDNEKSKIDDKDENKANFDPQKSTFRSFSSMTSLMNDINFKHILNNVMVFAIPNISTDYIKRLKIKEFMKTFRYVNLVFDIEQKEGIVFNFADGLECGIFGICGAINLDCINFEYPLLRLWKLINKSMDIIRSCISGVSKKENTKILTKNLFNKGRNDCIDIHSILAKCKSRLKYYENEKEEIEKNRNNLGNASIIRKKYY